MEQPSESVELPSFLRDSDTRDLRMKKSFDMFTTSELRQMIEPALRPSEEDFPESFESDDMAVEVPRKASTSSQGELNRSFRFGGTSTSPPEDSPVKEKPLTLSDIIPSPAHTRSLSYGEGDSVFDSILAQAADVRPRVDSGKSFSRVPRDNSIPSDVSRHARHSSEMSFAGFDSFDEVRRGFEFHDHRPAFYPPQSAVPRHFRNESAFSIASISSYGHVLNNGVPDPFDYGDIGLPSLQERHQTPLL